MLGLDISDRSIKLVRLSPDRHTLLARCWQDVPAGMIERGIIHHEEAVREVVRRTFAECRVPLPARDPVVASIPETQSFLRVVEIPVMGADEVSEAIQWEVGQHIPFGVENVYFDWRPVAGGHAAATGRTEVLVGAAQKQVVDPLWRVLSSLGQDVAALELESQAIARALLSPELRLKKGMLIVDVGGSATNVIIHDHGAIRFTATLGKGSFNLFTALTQEERAEMTGPPAERPADHRAQIAQKLLPGLEELAIETQGLVEFYNSIDAQHEVREIIMTGGGADLPGIEQAYLKYFDNVHVQRGNPWVNILTPGRSAQPPLDQHESVYYGTALGLALRVVPTF